MSEALSEKLRDAVERQEWERARQLGLRVLGDARADHGQVHALLGRIAGAAGNPEEAEAHFRRALDLGVSDPEIRARLSEYRLADDPAEAWELAGAIPPERRAPWMWIALGRAAHATGQSGEALDAWATAAEGAQTAELALIAAVEGAWAAAEVGDAEGAERFLSRALARTEAGVAAAWLALAEAVLVARFDEVTGCRDVERALARAAAVGLDASSADRHALLRAYAARQGGDLTKARAIVSELRARRPRWGQARRLEAELLVLAGEWDEASDAVAGVPSPPTQLRLALAQGLRAAGQVADALRVAREATEADPDDAGPWFELALCSQALEDEHGARDALARGLQLDSEARAEATRAGAFVAEVTRRWPQLVAAFDLPPGSRVRPHRWGHNALLLRVEAAGGPPLGFVKAFFPGARDRARIEATTSLQRALSEAELPFQVPRPWRTPQGGWTVACAGGWVTAMTACPGSSLRRQVGDDPRSSLAASHARALGAALAAFHAVTAKMDAWRAPPDAPGMGNGLRWLEAWARGRGSLSRYWATIEWSEDEPLARRLRRHVDALLPRVAETLADAQSGIIHGDFGWHNALWEGAHVVGLIDFDYAARDWLVADLVNGVHRCAFDWKGLIRAGRPTTRPVVAHALLEGYQEAGGGVPSPDALDTLGAAVRVQYYLQMAQAAHAAHGGQGPRGYQRPRESLAVLVGQLDWLQARGGFTRVLGLR